MKTSLGETFIAFVAGNDGICCVSFGELKTLLDEVHEEQEWVAVSRKHNENFRIRGKDGEEPLVVSRTSYPKKVVDFMRFKLEA